jgi:glycosyltransferase involved in cell wall biosynthesis
MIFYWVDYTATLRINTGVQRVTRMLAKALIARGEHLIPVTWNTYVNGPALASDEDRAALRDWNGPYFGARSAESEPNLMLAGKLDFPAGSWLLIPEVSHLNRYQRDATGPLLAYARRRGLKTAFLFYDALLIKWRIYQSLRRAHEQYMLDLANADLVLPISRQAARDLTNWWSMRAQGAVKARVLPCPLAAEFPGVARVTRPSPLRGDEIRIVCIGPIDTRKNQRAVIAAANRLPGRVKGMKVVVFFVGPGAPAGLGGRKRADKRIQFLGGVTEKQLIDLYSSCAFTVFPSLDEGFGLPIAESLWFGKPCICAGFGAMSELVRDGGCFTVDPRNLAQLTEALTRLINDSSLRQRLSTEACTRSLRTWRDYGASVLASLQQPQ